MKAANDARTYDDGDTFLWCDCGRGQYWIVRSRETGFYHIICSQCETDHTMTVIGE